MSLIQTMSLMRHIAEERLEDSWVPLDEKLAPEELEELIHAKEAHTNAAILESIGDIPDAEVKPPDNVLFVCKLNPVTEDEDLFTIFSRFGTVTSADIIRDYKTGDSLCYAFIEFEDKEACERAYFKMDNTLIDDRRIHVDFSQSVSRLWSQFRHGKGNKPKGAGGGCFKCGAADHFARDCVQGDANLQPGAKYVLKNDQTQHGDYNGKSTTWCLTKTKMMTKNIKREIKLKSRKLNTVVSLNIQLRSIGMMMRRIKDNRVKEKKEGNMKAKATTSITVSLDLKRGLKIEIAIEAQALGNGTWFPTVISCLGQYFCLHFETLMLGNNRFYITFLRFMGNISESSKYRYTLKVGGSGREMTWEGVPRSIRESHTTVRESYDGLLIKKNVALFFSEGDRKELNLKVTGRIWKKQ